MYNGRRWGLKYGFMRLSTTWDWDCDMRLPFSMRFWLFSVFLLTPWNLFFINDTNNGSSWTFSTFRWTLSPYFVPAFCCIYFLRDKVGAWYGFTPSRFLFRGNFFASFSLFSFSSLSSSTSFLRKADCRLLISSIIRCLNRTYKMSGFKSVGCSLLITPYLIGSSAESVQYKNI